LTSAARAGEEGAHASRISRARPLALALAVSVTLSFAGPARAESRIAVVDVQHAVMATEDGIRAQATLKKLFDKRQADLDNKQNELGRARDDIEKQSRVVSREALQKRMEDWQQRMVRLQTDFVEYNKELQKKQGELTAPIIRKMMETIARLAKKNGYEVVLDKQAAPYVRPDLDLTEQVVQLYNSGGGPDSGDEKKPDNK
jgi:outer membrane protein